MNDFKVDDEAIMIDISLVKVKIINSLTGLDVSPINDYNSFRILHLSKNEAIDALIRHLEGLRDD